MDRATELGHVRLEVRDVDRAIEFYRDAFGLDVTERVGDYAFVTFGEHHHDLALREVGPDADGPGRGVGMYHAAFEVEDADALAETYRRLRERGE